MKRNRGTDPCKPTWKNDVLTDEEGNTKKIQIAEPMTQQVIQIANFR